jgi:hypothetical protein
LTAGGRQITFSLVFFAQNHPTMKNYVSIVAACCLLVACNPGSEKEILGKWQAFSILEESDSLAVDPAEVGFEFRADQRYSYHSTLNYREEGLFEIRGEYLFTRDTTRADAGEKAVRIERLEADTLVLGMDEAGKARTLSLVKLTE